MFLVIPVVTKQMQCATMRLLILGELESGISRRQRCSRYPWLEYALFDMKQTWFVNVLQQIIHCIATT